MPGLYSGECQLWKLDQDLVSLTRVSSPFFMRDERAPIVFIHGVEYQGPEEAMRDLVTPMLKCLGPGRVADRGIYVFAWNSLLTNRVKISAMVKGSLWERFSLAARELPKCNEYLNDTERRAKDAAKVLLPFAAEWNAENRVGPTVISHSMGSLVWAETLRLLLEGSSIITKPGVWWSLQPAMLRNSFGDGGDYQAVAKIYTGRESSKALIWYSRMDYILSSIYVLSKPGLALGQWGCPKGSMPQRDITRWAREAHGMQHIAGHLGHFFNRVAAILPSEADSLGI